MGQSYRGGRIGEESFILDGLGVKNQLDAASGGLGLRIPPDLLGEASLVTNGFSARYGQALSGLVNVVTRDPGDAWEGRAAIETDRPFGGSLDHGLDRAAVRAGGPVAGGVGVVAAIDVAGRLDDDPVNAPPPDNPARPAHRASRISCPTTAASSGTAPPSWSSRSPARAVLRVFGIHSEDQRLLYDPAYKYDLDFAPAQRLRGDLVSGHLQLRTESTLERRRSIVDLRVGRFVREFLRGQLDGTVDYAFGALTGSRFHFVGEDVARAQEPVARPDPGLGRARCRATRTPWGVPAFFLGGGLARRPGMEPLRRDPAASSTPPTAASGGWISSSAGRWCAQQVRTYQRVLGFLPVGRHACRRRRCRPSRPGAWRATLEAQTRVADLAFTAGLRYDQFDCRTRARPSRGARSGR